MIDYFIVRVQSLMRRSTAFILLEEKKRVKQELESTFALQRHIRSWHATQLFLSKKREYERKEEERKRIEEEEKKRREEDRRREEERRKREEEERIRQEEERKTQKKREKEKAAQAALDSFPLFDGDRALVAGK